MSHVDWLRNRWSALRPLRLSSATGRWPAWPLFSGADRLTGALDRRAFEGAMQRSGSSGMLALVAVNRLKLLNEQRGWSAGNDLLRHVARTLRAAFPASTLIARWSGDEFLLFFPGQNFQLTERRLHRCQSTVVSPFPDQPAFLYGLTELPDPGAFPGALAAADHELYLGKGMGGVSAQRLGEERGLFELSRQLMTMVDPEEILTRGLHLVRTLLRFEVAAYATVEDGYLASQHIDLDPQIEVPDWTAVGPIPLSRLAARALQAHHTVVSLDAPNDPDATGIWKVLDAKSGMVTPVEIGGEAVGILWTVQITEHKAMSIRAQHVLEVASLRLAHALELCRTTRAVRQTLEGGLLGLGVALEARDLESYGHTRRVVDASVQLGQALGLDSRTLDELKQGAYLHDIGKLSIPDRILLKPGKLDPDEWQIMQGHAPTGAAIAANIPYLCTGALDVIRAHHERWDGAGYPAKLQGPEIPLLARIFAVCDVYDALTSERTYKAAWTPEEAQAELAAQSGRQFDPEILSVFLRIVDDVRTSWDERRTDPV